MIEKSSQVLFIFPSIFGSESFGYMKTSKKNQENVVSVRNDKREILARKKMEFRKKKLTRNEHLVDPSKLPGYYGDQNIDEICSRIEGITGSLHSQIHKITKNGKRRIKAAKEDQGSAEEDKFRASNQSEEVIQVDKEIKPTIVPSSVPSAHMISNPFKERSNQGKEAIQVDNKTKPTIVPSSVPSALMISNPFRKGIKKVQPELKARLWYTLRCFGTSEDHRNMKSRKNEVKKARKSENVNDIRFLDVMWREFKETGPVCYQPKRSNAKNF